MGVLIFLSDKIVNTTNLLHSKVWVGMILCTILFKVSHAYKGIAFFIKINKIRKYYEILL